MNPTITPFGIRPLDAHLLHLSRTLLPLKSVHCAFTACGGLAEVEMTQVYHQENPAPLDCEYVFPLPANAAVYRCEVVVQDRSIVARIEECATARHLAEAMRAQGFRTALVEAERSNLFTLSLGNLQPDDIVEVRLAYLQPLLRQGLGIALDLPLCPGVRYIPGERLPRPNLGRGTADDTDQVPDASCVSPPRIDSSHPDAAYVVLAGRIEAAGVEGPVTSPSHGISTAIAHGMVTVAMDRGGVVPDQGVALRWAAPAASAGRQRGWVHRHQGDDYLLLELQAPERTEATGSLPQDLYFLVDRSGSMQGAKWEQAVQALRACVEAMRPQDRAMVTFFSSSFIDYAPGPVPAAELRSDPRFHAVGGMGTDGGTEMEPALRHVLELIPGCSGQRLAALVLITDAQIGNEREVLAAIREHARVPVHCFGIDTVLNDGLLLDLVRQQGGTFHSFHPAENIAGAVSKLGGMLREPVLVNFSVPSGCELAGTVIPNLHAAQTQMVSLRRPGSGNPGFVSLTGWGRWNEAVSLQIELTPTVEAFPRRRWQKEQLVSLAARNLQAAAVELSREANMLCEFTAFVAWDEAEKVARAAQTLVQPAQEHVAYQMIFGRVASSQAAYKQSSSLDPSAAPYRQFTRGLAKYSSMLPEWSFDQPGWSVEAVSTDFQREELFRELWLWSASATWPTDSERGDYLKQLRGVLSQLRDAEARARSLTATAEGRALARVRAAELLAEFQQLVTRFIAAVRLLLAKPRLPFP